MEMNILKQEKNDIEVEVDNVTIVEVLRNYLHRDSSVEFAAWRREHPTKNPVLKIMTKGKDAKKALKDAVALVVKELDSLNSDFSKLK